MKYGVIVAEDEILIQQNIIKKIENSGTGFTVVGKAQTGIQALELINASNPYLLVTDIRMPVMDGLELIEQARENHPDLDVIVVSGYSDFEYAKRAIHLQVREYLLKPVDEEQLRAVLSS
ncbi:MAG: response regulator, partial [Lachnospira sp.]|nr:response regulator [Lachnospira sp.]